MDFSKLGPGAMNASSYFGGLTKAAKDLVAAEKRGKVPDEMDFGVAPVCVACKENIMPPKKALRCAACQAPIYCSRPCATKDWKEPQVRGAPTHKMLCADNKRHMERRGVTDAILKGFPWGRLETDGTFSFDIARGRFGVLGATGYGYWSHRGGPIPHSNRGELAAMMRGSPYESLIATMFKSFDHLDGADLLEKEHLTDKQGWKLEANLIPFLNFSHAPAKRPELVTQVIEDWDSWYKWRQLPKESPAALLMSFPMSVYWMLVHCLEVTGPQVASETARKTLKVHLLGAEVELNYLPLFGELALLLPYHDIRLVVFGSGPQELMQKAKTKPGSLAGRSSLSTPVFEYSAPKECGDGKISIHLYGESMEWSPRADGGVPDALVACNAGLSSYQSWIPVVQAAHQQDIPFAATEYAEQSAEHQRQSVPRMVMYGGGRPKKEEEYKIELNPFQRPGQRPIPSYRLPNLCNGFTLVVVKSRKPPTPAPPTPRDDLTKRLQHMDLELESLD